MTVTMFDPRAITATCQRLTDRAQVLKAGYNAVSVHAWGDGTWTARAAWPADLDAVAADPMAALDMLSVMLERRIRHDAKLAETLGVEAA